MAIGRSESPTEADGAVGDKWRHRQHRPNGDNGDALMKLTIHWQPNGENRTNDRID